MLNNWQRLVQTQLDLGQTKAARASLHEALRLAPDHPPFKLLAKELGM
jgi:cytochrome c-type biogenesis protein CcmH/NrfG